MSKSRDFSNWDNVSLAPSRYGGDWTVADYKAIDFSTEEGWQKAIDIFEDRIRSRFLDIVANIENMPNSGFAVMGLDSLLIETLEQTRKGAAETPRGQGKKYFVDFLTKTTFQSSFDKDKAEMFYEYVRCGILHQAEIKGSSRIRTDVDLPIVQLSPDGDGLIINRRKFHRKLVCVVDDYVDILRNLINQTEREQLRKKLDAICHYPYYFAYGSNMVSKRMCERIPEAEVVGIARLPDWKLAWDKISTDGSGKANLVKELVKEKKSEVWGVIYRCPEQKMPDLDKVEGGYQRLEVTVRLSWA